MYFRGRFKIEYISTDYGRKTRMVFGARVPAVSPGCQREIELDLPDYQSKLVIEGTIENGVSGHGDVVEKHSLFFRNQHWNLDERCAGQWLGSARFRHFGDRRV